MIQFKTDKVDSRVWNKVKKKPRDSIHYWYKNNLNKNINLSLGTKM